MASVCSLLHSNGVDWSNSNLRAWRAQSLCHVHCHPARKLAFCRHTHAPRCPSRREHSPIADFFSCQFGKNLIFHSSTSGRTFFRLTPYKNPPTIYSIDMNRSSQKGFTLIELLVVIAILTVLLSVSLIAINPKKQFSTANNTKRQSDVATILNAVTQYMADNNGDLPAAITNIQQNIESPGFAEFCENLVPTYLAAIPSDPLSNSGDQIDPNECLDIWDTGYTIRQISSNNRIEVTAPLAENGQSITVSR